MEVVGLSKMKSRCGFLLLSLSLASRARAAWSSWSDISYLFIFGNSYTATGFNISLEQPNPGNPLGNPEYPGWTSSNGPNWVDFLTTTYNGSYVRTYNFAYGGATVDSDLVPPYEPTVISMKEQVEDLFIPTYGAKPESAPWTADDSLFVFWIGVNDVGNTYWTEYDALYDNIFDVYLDLIGQISQTGGENFLFINVPPVERAPLTAEQGEDSQASEAAAIEAFNSRIGSLAEGVQSTHDGARVFQFDSHSVFTEVLDDPSSHVETVGYKNTTDYCEAYQDGTDEWDTFIPSCGIPVDQYFWLNSLHPTFPMHNATAHEITVLLAGE